MNIKYAELRPEDISLISGAEEEIYNATGKKVTLIAYDREA